MKRKFVCQVGFGRKISGDCLSSCKNRNATNIFLKNQLISDRLQIYEKFDSIKFLLYHNRIMMGIDVRFSYSQMDYENSGTINDIDDYVFETRGLIGYDLSLSGTTITPYIGIAYRWLYDDNGGSVSSTGAYGYDRESNYYYSPIGIKTHSEIGSGWSWGITAEFDYFWEGEQNSYLSDVSPTLYSDASNTQKDGYGVRGSIRFQKKWASSSFIFEPFIRYWEIDKSEYDYVLYGGVPNTAVYEPKNETIEAGAMFLFIF